jgi:hypothetical protein
MARTARPTAQRWLGTPAGPLTMRHRAFARKRAVAAFGQVDELVGSTMSSGLKSSRGPDG